MDCDPGSDAAVLSYPPGANITETGNRSAAKFDLVSQLQACVRTTVGEQLDGVERLIQQAIKSRYSEVEVLSRRAAAMGGKRLRPVLALLSAQVCSNHPLSESQLRDLMLSAASVELVHAASLVHDDVMDHADQRRHQPTIVQQAGNSAAVLLGDFLFTRAYAMAAACSSTYPARQIAAAATQLCEGELRQQASAGNWELELRDYKSILEQKTASLCKVSCRLGAWRAGKSTAQMRLLSNFGRLLGLAFQIHDDWLDYWGSDTTVGKTLGTDFAQLKPTLPLLRLLKVAGAAEREALVKRLAVGCAQNNLLDIRRQLDRSDAAAYTLATAKRCVERAKLQLSSFPNSAAKECLLAVADYSVRRNS